LVDKTTVLSSQQIQTEAVAIPTYNRAGYVQLCATDAIFSNGSIIPGSMYNLVDGSKTMALRPGRANLLAQCW